MEHSYGKQRRLRAGRWVWDAEGPVTSGRRPRIWSRAALSDLPNYTMADSPGSVMASQITPTPPHTNPQSVTVPFSRPRLLQRYLVLERLAEGYSTLLYCGFRRKTTRRLLQGIAKYSGALVQRYKSQNNDVKILHLLWLLNLLLISYNDYFPLTNNINYSDFFSVLRHYTPLC